MNQQEFLDEIEEEIVYLHDPYYAPCIENVMEKIKNYLDDRQMTWHPAKKLPTPRMPLRIKLDDGQVVDGIRPGYIAKYDMNDLGYRDLDGKVLMNVAEWSIA